MIKIRTIANPLIYLLIALLGLTACNLPQAAEATAPSINVTQAYQTVEARLTEAASAVPAPATQPPTATSPATADTPPTPAPTTPILSPSPRPTDIPPTEAACDLAAPGNPIDVTIADDTKMSPGQAFTKVWRLQNAGDCTWSTDYNVELFSGEGMGAPTRLPLSRSVAPGQSVDISIDMIAPATAGTHQGNWKLRNGEDAWFGIGPDGKAPFWVRVNVVLLPTATITPTAATPEVTTTPVVQVSRSATLEPGAKIDLDSNQANPGSGEDLSYDINAEGKHVLAPLGNVTIGVYGAGQPDMAACQAAAMGGAPVVIDNLPQGVSLCYRTNLGLPGRARITGVDPTSALIALDILTWALP